MSAIPQLVAQTAADQGVDANLALAVASAESNFNPYALSPAGAIGVMQLMPATAAQLGVDPHDPGQNIQGGVSYLRRLLSEFGGDTAAALAAYNWGPGNVKKAITSYGGDWLSAAPSETRNYVSKILGSLSSAVAPEVTVMDEFGNPVATSDGEGTSTAPYLLIAALGAAAIWMLW